MLHLLPFNKGLASAFHLGAPTHQSQEAAKTKENKKPHPTQHPHTAHLHRSAALASYLGINVLGNCSATLPLTHFSSLQGKLEEKF